MTELKRLLQALPLYRPSSNELQCRTKGLLAMRRWCRPGSSLAFVQLTKPATIRKQCTSYARLSTAANQLTAKRKPANIIFATGQPADLLDRVSNLPCAWELTASKKGIVRRYKFASFSKAWRFMTIVAEECKAKEHHPSWTNKYNQVTVEWTTHEPEGLSIKDVEMAELCDRTANDVGLKY